VTPFEERQARKRKVTKQLEELPAANKVRKDGSAYFKLIGGKHHDLTVRMFAPFDETDLKFSDGETYGYQTLGQVHAFTRIN
jgi:hypothetical protein